MTRAGSPRVGADGFLSEQGIVGTLGNASFSVVANTDGTYQIATTILACRVITAAAALGGEERRGDCVAVVVDARRDNRRDGKVDREVADIAPLGAPRAERGELPGGESRAALGIAADSVGVG